MLGMEIRGAGEPIVLDEEEYNAWTPGHRVTHFDSLPNVRRIYIANAFIDSSLHGYDQTPLTAGQWAYLENELIVKPNPERLMYFNPRDLETIERTDENRNAFFELIAYAGEQVLEDAINAVKARHDLWKPVRLW
ncbi:hypothetical protein FRB96_005486 [Tulasnella sp. 330]|nr:hypothetical protein FRB96_005486 [Tulasnella sp. 330]KAG8878481.1 hypothetical protein FRB97_002469 [Tulasnella sp. 331]KAG8880168.1 hypothetical protein FRB98_005310 [Tulasnella sp. 332]